MANIELARRAIKNIEANPDTWEQDSWHCGTAYCFAGHVALLAGATWADGTPDCEYVITLGDKYAYARVNDYARRVLEITQNQACVLFCGENELDDLKQIIDKLEAENGEE